MNESSLFTLLPGFYDPSPFTKPKIYLERIESEFGIKVKEYKWLKWAFDFDVFIINNEFVFRFPRNAENLSRLKNEIEFLKFLKGKFRIPIPEYSYISQKKDFAGYHLIYGNHLTPSVFKSLSKKNKERVIRDLIEFVNTFHQIDPETLHKFHPHTREEYGEIEKKVEQELEEILFPKLSDQDVNLIKNFYDYAKKIVQGAPRNCALHGDLYAYNVLWDKSKSQVAVIDFTDPLIGDPARDFEVFWDYGEETAKKVYEIYTGQKDAKFLERAKIYYQLHGIYTLKTSLTGAHISFEYAYNKVFKNKFALESGQY